MEKNTNFERCSMLEYLVILTGFVMLIFLVVHPEPRLHLGTLGIPGEALLILHKNYYKTIYNGLLVTFVIHVLETLYCIKVCFGLNMTTSTIAKWAIQTFIMGVLSLFKITRIQKDAYKKK